MRVNINKKIILSIIIILSITFISTISKAALEFKKNAKNEYSPLNASVAYQLCYDLKNSDSTLGINQVDPHLILNKDWTAVAFLSMSTYGKNSQYNSYVGDYQTSNGNYTGVMWNYSSITASIMETYKFSDNSFFTNIINNRNTKYVENIKMPITDASNKGLGLIDIYREPNSITPNNTYPSFTNGGGSYNGAATYNGQGTYEKFRPAIWNIDR